MPRAHSVREQLAAYLAAGWRPIPLHYVRASGACSCKEAENCGSPGKHPVFARWRDEVIHNERWWAWWAAHPAANVGLVTGDPSPAGFWVLDVDPRSGGDETMVRLQAEHGELPRTRRHATPGGGYHLLWLMGDAAVTNAPGDLKRSGVDVRGAGGQIAAPPSVGLVTKGLPDLRAQYRVVDDAPLVEAPAWLLAVIGAGPREVEASAPQDDAEAGAAPERSSSLDAFLAACLQREVQEVMGATEGERNHALNEAAFSVATMIGLVGVPDDFEQQIVDAFTLAAEAIELPAAEARKTIASAVRGGRRKPRDPWPPPEIGTIASISAFSRGEGGVDQKLVEYSTKVVARSQDDIGNGQRLSDWFGHVLRYVPDFGQWAVYGAGRWRLDDVTARGLAHRMFGLASKFEALRYSDTVPEPEEPEPDTGDAGGGGKPRRRKVEASDRERFVGWLAKQRMTSRIDALLKEARSVDGMTLPAGAFDQRHDLLNVPNGTIELDHPGGLVLREHRAEDLLMQMAATEWHADADRTEWDVFLKQVMPDQEDRDSLQAAAGYSIGGGTGAQVMFVHHGKGSNGKSVFADVISRVLGDLAQATPRETFAPAAADRHPTHVARMRGKRFITTIEPKVGTGLDEDLVKQLTGQDVMTARFMGRDFFEFRPTGKIHYFTNHLPRVSADAAVWRRVRLFVWKVTIPERERVTDLALILAGAGGPGVLAWLVEGYTRWQAAGLPVSDEQRARVAEWAAEEDVFGAWIEERCSPADGLFTPSTDLFASWCAWAEAGRLMPGTTNAFGRRLVERGYERVKAPGGIRGFRGLRVRRHDELGPSRWDAVLEPAADEKDPTDPFG